MLRSARALVLVAIVTAGLVGGIAGTAGADHQDGECSFPISVPDATDTEVTLEERPDEVVVVDGASAQILWDIGARDRVVGMPVRSYTAYLDGSSDRTDVMTEDGSDVDVETVVELDPDLVVAANPDFYSQETIQQLRDAGLTVYQYPIEESMEAIYAKTTRYGELVGECEGAAATVSEMRASVEEIEDRVASRDEPRVLYYFFEYTAGNGTFTHDLITTAGGDNVAATAGIEGFRPISAEPIVEQDPEWIVTTDDEGAIDTSSDPLASTTAVRNDQVLRVDANLISQAGPRVVEPLGRMAEAFHPPVTSDPALTTTDPATGTDTPIATEGSGEEPTPSPTTGTGPGFGLALVPIALLVFAARRAVYRNQ